MTPTSRDFPAGTPLYNFFLWNERRWQRDPRYRVLHDPARRTAALTERLAAAVGSSDVVAHAAVFAALEKIAPPRRAGPRRILVIRLSAFGDFVQALGPFAAIRRHHAGDHVTVLTTRPYAEFAGALGIFDAVMVDERPGRGELAGWLALRRRLRQGRFDRVYDLQTSQRSAMYARLWWPDRPEWSGIARGCTHPHANPGRDAQHTLDKQAEQLLMAGIYPTPPPRLPPLPRPLPAGLGGCPFALLVPGSSPQHPEKRWPAARFGRLAQALDAAGWRPVVVGSAAEAPLAAAIRETAPATVDLVGRTDLLLLAALTQRAALTVGNDTGVCHLAAAADCAVVVLFSRASDPARCAPRGRAVRVLAAPDLDDLAPETVIGTALAVLREGGGAPPPAASR